MTDSSKDSSIKTHQLDARHLLCPMPVIRVQQLIEQLGNEAIGELIESVCTDPGSLYDIPAWARVHGHEVLEAREASNEYLITIKICADKK